MCMDITGFQMVGTLLFDAKFDITGFSTLGKPYYLSESAWISHVFQIWGKSTILPKIP